MSSENTEETSQQEQETKQAGKQRREVIEIKQEDQEWEKADKTIQMLKEALNAVYKKPDPREDMAIFEYEDNDSGNADKFLKLYWYRLVYCDKSETWYIYDNKRWLQDKNGHEVRRLAERFYHRGMAVFNLPDLPKEIADRKKAFLKLGNCVVREHMLQAAATKLKFDSRAFNQQTELLTVKNGVINLSNGEFYGFAQIYNLTQYADINYDKQAEPPQRFLSFLDEIFCGDQELIAYVQKVLGYCLTGETREQCCFILWGNGSNGKSVLLNLLKQMLPEFVQAVSLSVLAEKRDYNAPNSTLVAARYARILLGNEMNSNMRLDESFIKTATGEDPVTARAIYKEEIEFIPRFKMLITVNSFPQVNWDEYAMSRRIRLIPFRRTFKGKEIDRELPYKLWQEREGILHWLVQGAIRWYAENLGEQPASVQKQLRQLQMDSSSFCDFYDQCLERTDCEEDIIQAAALYQIYLSWCQEHGVDVQDILSQKMFSNNLKRCQLLRKQIGHNRCNYYLGVRLKETLAAAEPQEETEIYGT